MTTPPYYITNSPTSHLNKKNLALLDHCRSLDTTGIWQIVLRFQLTESTNWEVQELFSGIFNRHALLGCWAHCQDYRLGGLLSTLIHERSFSMFHGLGQNGEGCKSTSLILGLSLSSRPNFPQLFFGCCGDGKAQMGD